MRKEERTLELWTGYFLRGSVFVCAAVIALGWAMSSFQPTNILMEMARGGEVKTAAFVPFGQDFFQVLRSFDGRATISLGLLMLILIPIVRVVLAAATFIRDRDRTYIIFSFLVLGFLGFGFFWGKVL